MRPVARKAWLEAADRWWHNPSGLYREAAAARRALEDARERLAELLDCEPERVVFVSGATEANNAVMAHAAATAGRDAVIAVGAGEHPSVLEAAGAWFRGRVLTVPTGGDGAAATADLGRIVGTFRPALVSLMAANNETGVLQPWQEALAVCQEAGIPFHCDAVQWLGRLPVNGLGECDFLTGSGHKFGGPKGVGFLMVPAGPGGALRWIRGGPQEDRRRAGTENLPAICGMVAALEDAIVNPPDATAHTAARSAFECELVEAVPGVEIIAAGSPRLWNTVMAILPPPVNVKWLARLSARGFAVSTGSACSRGEGASAVLAAMGVPHDSLNRVLRFSGGDDTTPADWKALASALRDVHREFASGARPVAPL